MGINIKNIKVSANLLLMPALLVIFNLLSASCVNPVDGTPPDESPPSLTIYSPSEKDTVFVGQNDIVYESIDDIGISYYEIYVDDEFANRYDENSDLEITPIYLNLGENKEDQIITVEVFAYDFSGNKSESNPIRNIFVKKLELPPAEPSNLVINKVSDKIFNLIWEDNSEDEEYFELWRKEDTSSFKVIRSLERNSISTNDTISKPNLEYSYQIKAVNSNGSSESNIVTTVPDNSNITAAPGALRGTAYGTSRIVLNWKDNSDNELAFKIERKISSGTNFEIIATVSANETSYTDTEELYPSTEYTYRVAAIGQFGISKWSNNLSIATLSYDIIPPSELTAQFNEQDSIVRLTWRDNSIFDIETRIERSSTNKNFIEIGIAGSNETEYSDSTVAVNNIYYYRVRSYTVDGFYSEYSETVKLDLLN